MDKYIKKKKKYKINEFFCYCVINFQILHKVSNSFAWLHDPCDHINTVAIIMSVLVVTTFPPLHQGVRLAGHQEAAVRQAGGG